MLDFSVVATIRCISECIKILHELDTRSDYLSVKEFYVDKENISIYMNANEEQIDNALEYNVSRILPNIAYDELMINIKSDQPVMSYIKRLFRGLVCKKIFISIEYTKEIISKYEAYVSCVKLLKLPLNNVKTLEINQLTKLNLQSEWMFEDEPDQFAELNNLFDETSLKKFIMSDNSRELLRIQ